MICNNTSCNTCLTNCPYRGELPENKADRETVEKKYKEFETVEELLNELHSGGQEL